MQRLNALTQELYKYQKKEKEWEQERQSFHKKIQLLEEQIKKEKAVNQTLALKKKHKRTSSEEQTFIFNQTNISSFYPMLYVKPNHWTARATLRSHLGAVRAVAWHEGLLFSSGEDCQLKVWEKDQLRMTVREHFAPIFTISSGDYGIMTAGQEGIIRKWNMSSLHNLHCDFEKSVHDDCIWDVKQQNGLLATASSDQTHKIFKNDEAGLLELTKLKTSSIPTSIDFLSKNKLISGYTEEKLQVYDLEKVKQVSQLGFQGRDSNAQTNKLSINQKTKIIASGHEDRIIRFFDLNSNQCVKSLVAHADSVTSVCFCPESFELISCGHDGNLRVWDLRKYRCISDIALHMKKFDEAALCLTYDRDEMLMGVGGADGSIKLLHLEQ